MTRPYRRFVLALVLGALGVSRALTQDKPAEKPPEKAQAPAPATEEAPPQGPATTFPAQIDMVTVDAVVTDKKGVAASALTKDDFILTEDGVPQSIVSFDAIQVPPVAAAAPKARPKISSNTSKEERSGRSFVVVFDDINLTPMMSQRAKGAVAEFLKSGVREGDRVLLVATGGAAWWSTRMESGREQLLELVKRLDGRYIPDTSPERMTDYEAMRINVFRDPQVMERVRRRYENYGVTHGNTSAQRQPERPRVHGRSLRHGPRHRGLLPGHGAESDHPRDPGARAPGPGGDPRPQVRRSSSPRASSTTRTSTISSGWCRPRADRMPPSTSSTPVASRECPWP